MATIIEVRNRADALLLTAALRIWRAQGEYYARHRRYWQGAWTHTTVPQDGIYVAANPLAKVASEALSWAEMGIFTESIATPFRLKCDVYGADDWAGYVIVAEAGYGGKVYQRAYAVGPGWAERTYDWRQAGEGI